MFGWRASQSCLLFLVLCTAVVVGWNEPPADGPPKCGSVLVGPHNGKFVYRLDDFMAGPPLKAGPLKAGPNKGYTYYLAPCRTAPMCGSLQGMAARCTSSSIDVLSTSPQGSSWSFLDATDPTVGIKLVSGKGPKCDAPQQAIYRTVVVNFVCHAGDVAVPRNFSVAASSDCKTTLTVMTSAACAVDTTVRLPPWVWGTNVICLAAFLLYVVVGCTYKVKRQNVPCGTKACPPGVKEFPFVVKDGCVFFGACLAPCLKRVCARFCGDVAASSNPPEGSDALARTKEQKSLLYSEKDISDLSYGAIPEPKKPEVLDVPGSISDKANPFHGTNF